MGEPVPGSTCGSWTKSGQEVETGQHGELVARGANVMRGYWNDPEETSARVSRRNVPYGRRRLSGCDGYFYILDRLKDMIVTGGENVYSGEVEAVIYQHPAVLEAAVFGIPDPQWGELVAACVVLKPGQALSADDLIAHCRRSLANYKNSSPRRVLGDRAAEERLRQDPEEGPAGTFLGRSETGRGLMPSANLIHPECAGSTATVTGKDKP